MDIPLPTTFYVEGTRHLQPVAALRAALERRVMHQKGVQSWKDRVVQVTRAPSTKAHTFWMRDSGFPEMPEFCRLSLETAVRRGGFSVHLWSCEQWDDLPVGVVLCDARKLAPQEWFDGMLGGYWDYASASHWMGLLALMRGGGGWLIQLDCFWLRPPPPVNWDEPCWGHTWASVAAPDTDGDPVAKNRFWFLSYLKSRGDRLCLSFPCHLPGDSPFLDKLTSWTRFTSLASRRPISGSSTLVTHGRECLTELGLEPCVQGPEVFGHFRTTDSRSS